MFTLLLRSILERTEMSNQSNQEEKVFSSALDLADVVLTSDLPQSSLAAIQNLNDDPTKKSINVSSLPFSLAYKAYDGGHDKCDILAFGCEIEIVSSVLSPVLERFPPEFDFLRTDEQNPFSINEEAMALFRSLLQDVELFQQLKNPSRPLIITGHSVAGWVASLVCLWVLENIHRSNRNIPMCITFGSPLIGDDGLLKAINNQSGWISRFVHVVSDGDLIPRNFLSFTTDHNKNSYKPFGTFLMCSPSGSACFDDPDSVVSLLEATGWSQLPSLMDYMKLLDYLTHQFIVSNTTSQPEPIVDSLRTGIVLQLEAIGDKRMQCEEEDALVTAMETQERSSSYKHRKRISQSEKKLNDMKMNMANLEFYKVASCTKQPIGYYDCYKNKPFERDVRAVLFKALLTKYWEGEVDEAEKKPRKPGVAPMGTRLLFGGTNYRRMVEPLEIAEYYRQGKRDYRTQGRPKHYILLQIWLEEDERTAEHKGKSKEKASTLTEDSCFWADVEEAMILTKSLKHGETIAGAEESPIRKLQEFEDHVMGLIDNLAVSPEIFLKESTFMQWWKEYENSPHRTHRSSLATFMEKKLFLNYK